MLAMRFSVLSGEPGLSFSADRAAADRMNDDRQEGTEDASGYLCRDERRGRAGRNPGIGVGEGAADRDGRVSERGGGGEPGGRADPGADSPACVPDAAGPVGGQGDQRATPP